MKIFEVNTWPVFLRWILFMPVSILAFMLFYFVSYIGDLRYPRGAFIFLFMIQLIGRPLTAYVGMYIVPKAKKIIGYIYVLISLIDLLSNIFAAINGSIDFDLRFIGNSIGILIGSIIILFVIPFMFQEQTTRKNGTLLKNIQSPAFSSFTDPRDGTIYKSVRIGHQVWMAENLRYIPHVSPVDEDRGIWVYNYNGHDIKEAITSEYYKKYGSLYNWEKAKLVCPEGWHLSTDDEWSTMINYLGGEDLAGGKLKSRIGWKNNNPGTTNESGFSALPGGYRIVFGGFSDIGLYGHWWSATEYDVPTAWARHLSSTFSDIENSYTNKVLGLSVRCVKD